MKHSNGRRNSLVPASGGIRFPLTRLDIATLAAGATRHRADGAFHSKLLAAGLLQEDALTGYLRLTKKGCALLVESGYTFVPRHGWRIDTSHAIRLLQAG